MDTNKDDGSIPMQQVTLDRALAVFQALSATTTEPALHAAMLRLAADLAQGSDACLLQDGQMIAQLGIGDSTALRVALTIVPMPSAPALIQAEGGTCIIVPMSGGQTGHLCVAEANNAAPDVLHSLALVAACGSAHLDRMANASVDESYRDVLTGLPNRDMLIDRLTQAIAMGERGHFVVATALINLDGFKLINNSFGRELGDVLLKTVAGRLTGCTRKCDTVARLEGDEFVLVTLHNTILAADAPARPAAEGGYYSYVSDTLAKIQRVLADTILLGESPLSITCSIGVSIYPQDGHDADTQLLHAHAAMHAAKRNGRNRIKFYTGDPLP